MNHTMASNGRIGVAVMGQGRSGYNIHVRCMGDVESVTEKFVVVAVADALVRHAAVVEELGFKVYGDWRRLLSAGGFDMVVNSLHAPLHVDATIEALKSGFHVFFEKSLAKKVADVDRILDAEHKSGKILFPFQQNRLQPFCSDPPEAFS